MSFAQRARLILIAAAISSLAACLWSYWAPATYVAEIRLTSSVRAHSQIFFDRGGGFNETDSATVPVPGRDLPVVCRFPLPTGTYRALRFDPIDRAGTVVFSGLRIVNPAGRVVRRFDARDFRPAHQIADSTVRGASAHMASEAGGDDPYYLLTLPAPFTLHESRAQRLARTAWHFSLWFVLVVAAVEGARRFLNRFPETAAAARRRAALHPHGVIASLAVAAAVAASYPVVFCARSLVSPDLGAPLLHDSVPTVPGVTDLRRENVHGADIGAMLWQHLPYTVMQHRALFRDGELPLWNRYNSCGLPLLGQGQSMFGDPLHLPELLAGGAAGAFDFRFVFSRALWATAIGFIVWAATRDLAAAALATVAAAFVGFFNCRLNHPAIFSVSVAPWVLWCWIRLAHATTRRAMAAWSLGLLLASESLLTSGTVKEAYMLLLALHLAGGLLVLFSAGPPAQRLRRLAHAVVAGVIVLLLTAPVWLTFRDTLAESVTSTDRLRVQLLPAHWMIGMFDDLFYRELSNSRHVLVPSLNFVLLLGVLWFVVCLRRFWRDPVAVILTAGAVGSVALVFGAVPAHVIQVVPLLRDVVHVADTFSCVSMVFLAGLAGYGFHAARDALASDRWWRPAGATLLLLAALLAAYFHGMTVYWSGHSGLGQWRWIIPAHRFFFVYLALMLVAVLALTLAAARVLRLRRLSPLAGFTAALSLVVLLGRNGLQYSRTNQEVYFTTPAVRAHLRAPSRAVAYMQAAADGRPFRAVGTGDTLFPGFSSVYGLEGINGPDALVDRSYAELMRAAGLRRPGDDWRYILQPDTLNRDQAILDMLNVRYCVTEPGAPPPGGTYQKAASLDLAVYTSPTVWPRAFFTDTVIPYRNLQGFVAMVRASSGRPFAAVREPDLASLGLTALAERNPRGRRVVAATRYRLTTNSTTFTVHAPAAGVVVLQEAGYPADFRVTVEGRPARCFRVNGAFKAVAVPRAGTYRVTFTYRPVHFTLALILCGVGVLLLIGGCLAIRWIPA